MADRIKCRSKVETRYRTPEGDEFTLPAETLLYVERSGMTAERTMNGGGFHVDPKAAMHLDSGGYNLNSMHVYVIDPNFRPGM